jgi:hypothetical protein
MLEVSILLASPEPNCSRERSTPLAGPAAQLDDERSAALEREVVARWRAFIENGGLAIEIGISSATAHK